MKLKLNIHRILSLLAMAIWLTNSPSAIAQGTTAFTYQGQVRDGSTNANGNYSLAFKLFDAATSGNQVGTTLTFPAQLITNGLFTTSLDFGDVFGGAARWLEITVQTDVLARERITPVPYATYAAKAASADSAVNTVIGAWTIDSGSANVPGGGTFADALRFQNAGATRMAIDKDGNGVVVNGNLRATNGITSDSSIRLKTNSSTATISNDGAGNVNFSGGVNASSVSVQGVISVSDIQITNSLNIGSTTLGSDVFGFLTVSDIHASGHLYANGGVHTSTGMTANDVYGTNSITCEKTIYAQAFQMTSDRNAKEKFTPVNSREVLERVVSLPISNWNYKEDATTRHIGPMAQDFHAAFAVGIDEKHIATVDADGVALAAIQGLHEMVKAKDAELAAMKQRLADLEKVVSTLVDQKGGKP